MTAAAPAAVGIAAPPPRADRRLGAAVLVAVGLHAALLWQSRSPAHGERLLEPAPAMSVRVLEARPAVATPPPTPAVEVAPADAPVAAATPPPAMPPPLARTETPTALAAPRATSAAAAAEPPVTPPAPPAAVAAPTAPSVPVGLPAAPDYALSARLDPGPQPLDDIQPEYPEGAELRSGTVVLRLLIGETGRVDNVGVVRAQPAGVFDAAAVAAFEKARFAPGRLLGVPVKSQITIEVAFTPLNRGPRVSGRGY